MARSEVEKGFPLTYAQAAISLWSALEDAVNEAVAVWLNADVAARLPHAALSARVRLGEYLALSGEDRTIYLIDLISEQVGSRRASGVERFELLLAAFGLGGPVREEVRRSLFELQHIRNVLVHRRGRADSRLRTACPWLHLGPGDVVQVDGEKMERYFRHAGEYGLTLANRVAARCGLSIGSDLSFSLDIEGERHVVPCSSLDPFLPVRDA